MRKILLLSLVLSALQLSGQKIINGFQCPEAVTSDGKRFFVSNLGQDVVSKDGDGFITEISTAGKIIELKFLPTEGVLDAPKGMAIENNILYVADLNRIVGFDINSRKTVFELTIPKAIVLNDICRFKKDVLLLTDTGSGAIYQLNTRTKSYEIIANIPSVNGIAVNKKTDEIAIGTNGEVWGEGAVFIKQPYGDFKKLPNIPEGLFDGVKWLDEENLLLSDWVSFPPQDYGKIWIYNLKNKQAESFLTDESIANFYFESSTGKIYMPQMFRNRIIISDLYKLSTDKKEKQNQLYQYGIADAFLGGLYNGTLPLKELCLQGDFGLGAADLLDGELTILNGIVYQTKETGETTEAKKDLKTPLSFITFFKADTVISIEKNIDAKELLKKLKNLLPNKNGMYAIKISGKFSRIKTRAFPAVEKKPFPPITELLEKQQFFNFSATEGSLICFYMPEYLNGINSKAFHLHFLSTNKKQGGHVLDFNGEDLKIEIAKLKNFNLEIPESQYFKDFKFKKKKNEELKSVEQDD